MASLAKLGSAASEADSLFRRFNVAAIRGQDHVIKNDIEAKKQDLRVMVGERYRELIDAADSIMAMRSGAQAIEGMFSELQERCNIALLKRPGSGAEAGGDAASADRDAMVHRVAAQIKLLVDTPEQIWYNLERTHYLQAAQLYLVAKHVFRSLQTMRDSSSVHTLDTFPVARRQWDAVSRFQSQIMQKTRQNLKFVHQSDQAIANSICAMILLERISIKQAIAAFFDMRRAAMQELFSSFDAGSTNVAEFLAEVANLLFVTVRHAWGVFGATPNSKSLLETTLASLADAGGPAPSSALAPAKSGSTATDDVQSGWLAGLYSERTNVHIMARHLPPNLREQTAAGDDLIFAPSDLAEEAAVWMHETTDLARTGMRQVLRSISSGQHLWATRRALMADVAREESSVQKGSGRTRQGGAVSTGEADHGHLTSNSPWAEICRALLGRPVSLWASIMQEPFVERAKDIIRQAFKELAQQPEAVVAPFVERFRTSPSGQDKFGPDAASLQTRSMSPWTMTVSEISSSFERTIRNIQEDVEVLLKDKGGVPVDSVPSPLEQGNLHLEQDGLVLRNTFSESGVAALMEYASGLDSLLRRYHDVHEAEESVLSAPAVDQCLLVGRIARAILLRCRGLFLALSAPDSDFAKGQSKAQRSVDRKLESDPRFAGVREAFLAIGERSYLPWLSMVARQAGEWLDEGLRSEDWDQALGFKEVWEPVAVKAEDLDGAPAEESISLPVQASAPIVDVFFRVCQDMNRIGGHLLEKSTLQRLLSSLSRSFEATFARFVSDFADAISDKGALQLLFDLSFVSKVLGDAKLEMDAEHSSRAKQHLADLVPRVRRMVDPIDLSISDRHIGTNVERFFYRTSVLFGPLLVLALRGVETKHNPSLHEIHNIVALSTQASRFTLLPVIPLSNQGPSFDRLKAADLGVDKGVDARERGLALPSAGLLSPKPESRIARPQRRQLHLYGQGSEDPSATAASASGMSVLSSLVEQGGKALLSSIGGILMGSD